MWRAPSPTRRTSALVTAPRTKSSTSSLQDDSPTSSPSIKSSSSGLSYRAPSTRSAKSVSASAASSTPASSKSSPVSSPKLSTSLTTSSSPSRLDRSPFSYVPPTPANSRPDSPTSNRLPKNVPVLEVFGDSFSGVFTLLGQENVAVNRITGASARVSLVFFILCS